MIDIKTSGIAENAAQLKAIHAELPAEQTAVMIDGTSQIERVVSAYPPAPPYVGMQNYGAHVSSYAGRTGAYGENVHASVVTGGDIIGYVESGAPHSIWLRGTPIGDYLGAWMHRPFWRPLLSIVNEWGPKLQAMMETRISALIKRIRGD